jgi:hypothetical protein
VIAQCEKYVREFGPGVIIFRDGYVKCPLTSPTPDSGYRYVDWQDRPRLPAAGLRHGEASDESQGGLEWESRYRLLQSREIG